ncbi:MAG: tripartite tricarboxylate transporter substrate binding protein [Frateuria sp.]|nr:tripartite tricarboxylate transporter substrate binding protein [Frateuria sp.]
MSRRRMLLGAVLAIASAAALAQGFPEHTIRMVVPFPPGGGFDGIARPFAERLGKELGQPVIVDNRPGAGGNIGAEQVAKSTADGYTLLFANDFLGTNPNLYKEIRYNPVKDFAPISMVGSTQMVIAVNPARVKATDARSLKAASQERPLQYGTPGVGTSPHLFGELYAFTTGTRMQHVPYKGTGPAITDAIGGQIDFALVTVPSVVPHARSGKLRPLMVFGGQKRSALLPDVPTVQEQGIGDVNHDVWYALFAPAGTPPEALKKLREATARALADPELARNLRELGYEVTPSSPEQLGERVKSDLGKWKQVIERAKITLD